MQCVIMLSFLLDFVHDESGIKRGKKELGGSKVVKLLGAKSLDSYNGVARVTPNDIRNR